MMSPRGCFVLVLERQNVFLRCYHVNPLFLSCKTLEHRSRKSRDLCRQENSHSAFSVVACVLCTFVPSCLTHPLCARLRVGIIFLLDAVSENIPSWHGLCLSCMVIASAAILLC